MLHVCWNFKKYRGVALQHSVPVQGFFPKGGGTCSSCVGFG